MTRRRGATEVARQLFDQLSPAERWELGDALVLGTFDWREWSEEPLPPGTTAELDYIRMHWEDEQA